MFICLIFHHDTYLGGMTVEIKHDVCNHKVLNLYIASSFNEYTQVDVLMYLKSEAHTFSRFQAREIDRR